MDKQTNQQRSRLKVVADNIQLLSSRPAGQPGGGDGYAPAQPQYRPQYQQPQYPQQYQQPAQQQYQVPKPVDSQQPPRP